VGRVLAAGLGLVCLGCGELSSSAPEQSGFRLESIPGGATVRVDGQPRGTTPLTMTDLTARQYHTIQLDLAGFQTWRRQLAVAHGAVVELPPVTLARVAREQSDPAPAKPLRGWPTHDGLPDDFLVSVKEFKSGWHSDTTIRALGPGSAEVTLGAGRHSHLTCSYPIAEREIARFDWNEFVAAIEAGRQRQNEAWCYERSCDGVGVIEASIRAFGRALSTEDVKEHRIGFELKTRVAAVTRGVDPWPHQPVNDVVQRLDGNLTRCVDSPATAKLELAIARESGVPRLISLGDAASRTEEELACIRETIATTKFPSSRLCELRLELDGYALSAPRRPSTAQ
jgi:hypothetical protein